MSQFNQRQFEQMENLIQRLRKRDVSIPAFVADQWSLIEMLTDTDLALRRDLTSLVNEIEDMYADSVERGLKEMSAQDVASIELILQKMSVMVKAYKISN